MVRVHTLAVGAVLAAVAAASSVDLATFDGKAPHRWHSENDPVMGGQSSSSFSVAGGVGVYSGTCRLVPKLQAAGFTIAMTEAPLFGSFPDASATDGLSLGVRNAGGDITAFKVAFCDSRVNWYRCQFGTFKADFEVQPSSEFQDIFVPWSEFSDKWSASTGKHTAEEPPTASSLKSITQMQIWTEGVLGDFRLEIKYLRAEKAPGSSHMVLV